MNRLKHCEQMLELICEKLGIAADTESAIVKKFHDSELNKIRDANERWHRALKKTLKEMDLDYLQITVNKDIPELNLRQGCYEMTPDREVKAWVVLDINDSPGKYKTSISVDEIYDTRTDSFDMRVTFMIGAVSDGRLRFNNYPLERKHVVSLRCRIEDALRPWKKEIEIQYELRTSESELEFDDGTVLTISDVANDMIAMTVLPRENDEDDIRISFHSRSGQVIMILNDQLIHTLERWIITKQIICKDIPLEVTSE